MLQKYQQFCSSTSKEFDSKNSEIANWGLGVAGEAGDIAGCIKKTIFHNNDQIQGIRENIGDTMWYIAMICNFYNWNLEDILEENMNKLKQRYPNGFDEQKAQRNNTRVDWNEN